MTQQQPPRAHLSSLISAILLVVCCYTALGTATDSQLMYDVFSDKTNLPPTWLPSNPITTWFGCGIDDNGMYCILSNSAASGSLDLTKLPATMYYLDLSRNKFTGSIDLTQLPATLLDLRLNNNELSGSVDLTKLPAGMKHLNLRDNHFTGTVDTTKLPASLNMLDIAGNNFDNNNGMNSFKFSGVYVKKDAEGHVIEAKDVDVNGAVKGLFNAVLNGDANKLDGQTGGISVDLGSGNGAPANVNIDLGSGDSKQDGNTVDLKIDGQNVANNGGATTTVQDLPNGGKRYVFNLGRTTINGDGANTKFGATFSIGNIFKNLFTKLTGGSTTGNTNALPATNGPSAAPSLAPSCVIPILENVEKSCGSSVMQLATTTCASEQYGTVCGTCMEDILSQDTSSCPAFESIKNAVTVSCSICHSFATHMRCGPHNTCRWCHKAGTCCSGVNYGM